MGMLVEGKWQAEDLPQFARDGSKVRFDQGFYGVIDDDGKFLPEQRIFYGRNATQVYAARMLQCCLKVGPNFLLGYRHHM